MQNVLSHHLLDKKLLSLAIPEFAHFPELEIALPNLSLAKEASATLKLLNDHVTQNYFDAFASPTMISVAETMQQIASTGYNKIASSLADTLEPYSALSLELESILQPWESSWSVLSSVSPPLLTFSQPALDSIFPLPSLLPNMERIFDLTEHLNSVLTTLPYWSPLHLRDLKEKTKQRLVDVFKLIRFCFAPSMTEDLMYRIADTIERNGKPTSVNFLIWNYYAQRNHARLQEAVESRQDNPEFMRRWKQRFFPAFQAHTRKEYDVVALILTPQVEGISSHIVQKNALKKPTGGNILLHATQELILRTLQVAGDEERFDETTDLAHWVRVKSAMEYTKDFCRRVSFSGSYDAIHTGKERINRHGLCHGIQMNVPAFDSLRLFLLLDTMYALLQNYRNRGATI